MKTATLLFIVQDGRVLLGEKKRGEIGTNTLNGPGGKLEEGETFEECVVRETREEFELDVYRDLLDQVAHIVFHAGGEPDFDVYVYLTDEFSGELCETKEVYLPAWYPIGDLPVDRMLESDREWISKVLAGERFSANVYYRERAKGFERIEFLKPDF